MIAHPFSLPEIKLDKNIVIVGSSGNLLDSNYGAKIDSFTEVVRFNRAPTVGYESDVGSKTTLRVVNNHVFNNNDISREGYTNQPKDFIRNLRNSRILYFAEDLTPWQNRGRNSHSSNDLHLFNYGLIRLMKDKFDYPRERNPTLGVGFACMCVILGIIPTLFGFDTDNRTRDHYYEKSRPNASSYHGVNFEKQLLVELAQQKKIIIY
mgnify:CR=1 FL=1